MKKTVELDRRFCGPPDSGNGGYVCGRLAAFSQGAVEVTLHRPPPLNKPMQIRRRDAESVALHDGQTLVAEARPVQLEIDIPAAPDYETAKEAASHYSGFRDHFYPLCFVCGPQRREGDGLRIFAGPVPGRPMVAAPWTPHLSLANSAGIIQPEFIWAALDCPGYFAVTGARHRMMLLGRMTAQIQTAVPADARCIVIGWPIASEGRKEMAGTALFSENGHLYGTALSTWIELKSTA